MKVLLWEGDGFLLLYKRLDNGYFQWPRNGAEAKQLTHEQYIWLLQGLSIEQPKAIKPAPKNVKERGRKDYEQGIFLPEQGYLLQADQLCAER